LLDGILKQSTGLRLVSLKSLPVTSLNEPIAVQGKQSAEKNNVPAAVSESGKSEAAADGIFKHGVEIVVQGGYLDMMHYMASLQETPWQLFWGKAELSVDEYPKITLKLTLFTLSLDKRWLNL
jgi:MSHA biogenesis protein MshJ